MVIWDGTFETLPPNSEDRSIGAQRIRDLKVAVSERADGEHNWGPTGSTNSGDHIEGSGRAFYTETALLNRCTAAAPQGVYTGPALGANDRGRMLFRTAARGYAPFVWDGTNWRSANNIVSTGVSTTTEQTTFGNAAQTVLEDAGPVDWEFGPGATATVEAYLLSMQVMVHVQATGGTRHMSVQLQYTLNGGAVWNLRREYFLSLRQDDATVLVFNEDDFPFSGGAAVDLLFRVRASTSSGNPGAKFNAIDAAPFGAGSVTSTAYWTLRVR